MFFFYFFERTEQFIEEMFRYLDIDFERGMSTPNNNIDYILKDSDNLDTLVEVKEIKNNYRDVIIGATNRIRDCRKKFINKPINNYSFLIIFGTVNKEQKDYFLKDNIVIIDISNILYLIKDRQELIWSLKDILPFSIVDVIPEKIQLDKYINYKKMQKNSNSNILEDELIQGIKSIEKGIEGAREFEIVGEKVIKFLFGDYIYDWKSQINCDNGLHRIDLLGKVKDQHGFWKMLYDIYKSRYIIFEFKNYNNRITQEQVEITNKYLNKNALRTVAIIISREGIDKNAQYTCKSFLRSQGQLILTLNEKDLIFMLESKRENHDKDISSEYMEKIFDDFLLEVEK